MQELVHCSYGLSYGRYDGSLLIPYHPSSGAICAMPEEEFLEFIAINAPMIAKASTTRKIAASMLPLLCICAKHSDYYKNVFSRSFLSLA